MKSYSVIQIAVAVVSVLQLFSIFSSMYYNGLWDFNFARNDEAVITLFTILNIIIGACYFFTAQKRIGPLMFDAFMGTYLLLGLFPYILYFMGFDSNDYERLTGIIVVPIIVFVWIKARKAIQASPSRGRTD